MSNQFLLGKSVLIVDYEESIAKDTAEILKCYGADPIEMRHNSQQALQALLDLDRTFDLVVMEIVLPPDHDDEQMLRRLDQDCDNLRREMTDNLDVHQLRQAFAEGDQRLRRAAMNRQLTRNYRNLDGGISMIEAWHDEMIQRHGRDWLPETAVLFFTTQHDVAEAAKKMKESTEWCAILGRPSGADQIIEAISSLLLSKLRKGGG